MKFPANVDFQKGQLINARAENIGALPVFVPGEDEGRFLFVTAGPDAGYWLGAASGAAFSRVFPDGHIAEYDVTSSVNDGVTATLTVAEVDAGGAQRGIVTKVSLTSITVSSGQVRVEMFEDAARLVKFYDAFFDMANQQADRFPVAFELDNASGNFYINITNLSGSNGTFGLVVKVASIIPVQAVPPPGAGSGINAGVAGDGIAYDPINARLDADLVPSGGLEMVGIAGARQIQVKVAPGGGLATGAPGASIDTSIAVVSGVDQNNITNLKLFAKFGIKPAVTSGPPLGGTHSAGELYADSNLDLWQCLVGGTPGTWIFYGWKEEHYGGDLAGSSYTVAVAAGNSVSLEVPTTGRRGFIRKLSVWGADSVFAASNIDVPFRVACYPNENLAGREQLWSVSGQIRKTFITAPAGAGGSTATLNTVATTNLDDLVRIRKAVGPLEEYQRVVGRNTGTSVVTFDETLVNSFVANDNLMFVNEYIQIPWRNNSGVPANAKKIYLNFFNDDVAQTVIFGYEVLFESQGGGIPI